MRRPRLVWLGYALALTCALPATAHAVPSGKDVGRVADLIERQTGQKFHPGHVWRILRSLGWSCQRPVGRATQRDEPAILQWKRVRWPEIKKKRSSNAEP